MSRGHGHLQRRILELLEQHPDGAPGFTTSLATYGPFEWTTDQFFSNIHWQELGNVVASETAYSAKSCLRRALKRLEADGLIYRRPSSATYRHPGSIPWVWALSTQGISRQT
jgi:hypothetical protein